MSFSNLYFIFLFLPLFVLIHAVVKGKARNAVLFFGSLLFYFLAIGSHYEWLVLLLLSAFITYAVGLLFPALEGGSRKALLICSVVFHVLMLSLYKYAGTLFSLLLPALAPLFGTVDVLPTVLLPLGISFYTFKNIAYLHDVYSKKTEPERSFLTYGAYLCLFPQVTMGPIQSYAELKDALTDRSITLEGINSGIVEFILGLGLKAVLADRLGAVWNGIETIGYESISAPLAWLGLLSYSLQLYFDFYGYTLMATGIGRMLGYETPKNFLYPYTASSMTDFWRRWHITLGTWFREHVYIPLGGNRCGRWKLFRNLLIVWLLTGVWHGNTAMFLLWGLVLFAVISIEKTGILDPIIKNRVLSHLYMIPLILFSWMIFRIATPQELGVYFTRLFPFLGETPDTVYALDFLPYVRGLGHLMAAGIVFATPLPRRLFEKIKGRIWLSIPILLILFWYSVYLIANGADNPFMYVNY